jgi:hypothetical protein
VPADGVRGGEGEVLEDRVHGRSHRVAGGGGSQVGTNVLDPRNDLPFESSPSVPLHGVEREGAISRRRGHLEGCFPLSTPWHRR